MLLPQEVYDEIPTFPVTPSQGLDDARMRLHLFYALGDPTFAALVGELRQLRALAPEAPADGPLDLHPALLDDIEARYPAAPSNSP